MIPRILVHARRAQVVRGDAPEKVLCAGLAAGIVFYQFRERERRRWSKFSDAGGLTRLNLDELSE